MLFLCLTVVPCLFVDNFENILLHIVNERLINIFYNVPYLIVLYYIHKGL